MQLDDPARGFAFRHDGPLDMRFDPSGENATAEGTGQYTAGKKSCRAPVSIRRREGRAQDRRRDRRPAADKKHRGELADVAAAAAGKQRRLGKIHPATKVFQAIRIAVNKELQSVEKVLPIAVGLLRPGGRLAVDHLSQSGRSHRQANLPGIWRWRSSPRRAWLQLERSEHWSSQSIESRLRRATAR